MKFKTEKKRIGAFTYHVTQLDASRGSKAMLRVVRLAAPVIALAEKGDETAAWSKLAESLTDSDFEYFCDLFTTQTIVTGGAYDEDAEPALDGIFDEHFAANYFEMLQWLTFCFEVNFASFFAGAAAKVAAAKSKASATASISPKPLTGTSGES